MISYGPSFWPELSAIAYRRSHTISLSEVHYAAAGAGFEFCETARTQNGKRR
jgi:hypothetical protein